MFKIAGKVEVILQFEDGCSLVNLLDAEAKSWDFKIGGCHSSPRESRPYYSFRSPKGLCQLVLTDTADNELRPSLICGVIRGGIKEEYRQNVLAALQYVDGINPHNLRMLDYQAVAFEEPKVQAAFEECFSNVEYYYCREGLRYIYLKNIIHTKKELKDIDPSFYRNFFNGFNGVFYCPEVLKGIMEESSSVQITSRVFIKACEVGDLELVKLSLKMGAVFNNTNLINYHTYGRLNSEFGLIQVAIKGKNPEILKIILDNVSSINLPFILVEALNFHCSLDCLKIILEKFKGNFSPLDGIKSNLIPAIVNTMDKEVIEAFREYGVGIDKIGPELFTLAAKTGNVEFMKLFYDAYPKAKDSLRKEMFVSAVKSEHTEMIKFLVKENSRNCFIQAALGQALREGNVEYIEFLITAGGTIEGATREVGYLPNKGKNYLKEKGIDVSFLKKIGLKKHSLKHLKQFI